MSKCCAVLRYVASILLVHNIINDWMSIAGVDCAHHHHSTLQINKCIVQRIRGAIHAPFFVTMLCVCVCVYETLGV